MIVANVISLGAAIIGLISAIAGASACAHNSSSTSRTNLALLSEKVRALEILIDKVKQLCNSTAEFIHDPIPWIQEAEELKSRIDKSEVEVHLDEKCMNGWLPSVCVQLKARKLLEEQIRKLDLLIKTGSSIPTEKVKGHYQPIVDVIGTSRTTLINKIWQDVSECRVGTICIHGIAGVGKTVIAAEIHNRALVEPLLFDYVIWVSVKYGSTLWQIQEAISSGLSINICEIKDTCERAQKLSQALMQRKKFLLVLDSMWQPFSFQEVGIPEPKDGCKLIVTSRVRSVCKSIKSKELFEIKPLTKAEAWELFRNETGPMLRHLNNRTLTRTNDVVIEELDGLPAAIKILALKFIEVYEIDPLRVDAEWAEELDALDGNAAFHNRWIQDSFEYFKQSYFNLPSEMQPFLLFCAVYPKGCVIQTNELISYWMSGDLLGTIKSLHHCKKKGKDVLKDLINAHLLEKVEECQEESVKMLNLVRLMAMEIIFKEKHQFLIKSDNSLSAFPPGADWPLDVERASFMDNQLKALALNGEPNCKQLSMLFIQDNLLNSPCSSGFFDSMLNLKVLDISRTSCHSLPKSLGSLVKLQALFLRDCPNLRFITTLSHLHQLVVLDLSDTPLDRWPAGIQFLQKLKCLNLSQNRLEFIPAKVISNLKLLEELLLNTDYDLGYLWGSNQIREACIEELVDLKFVTVLELSFQDAKVFNKYVMNHLMAGDQSAHAPASFKFRVGRVNCGGHEFGKNSIVASGDYHVVVPEKTYELYLMMNCELIFTLTLTGCLKDLKVVDISDFSGLRYLFTVEMIGLLENLEKISVRQCRELRGITQPRTRTGSATISLPYLREMALFDLQLLESICQGLVLNCPLLRTIEVWRCMNLRLPMIRLPEHHKIELKGEESWLSNLRWDNPHNADPDFCGTPDPRSVFRLSRPESDQRLSRSLTPGIPRREGSTHHSESEDLPSTNSNIRSGGSWFLVNSLRFNMNTTIERWLSSLRQPLNLDINGDHP